jgi:hypothetical protein
MNGTLFDAQMQAKMRTTKSAVCQSFIGFSSLEITQKDPGGNPHDVVNHRLETGCVTRFSHEFWKNERGVPL